jgi:hypothetical protein
MFQTKVGEKVKTHILCSITFFSESRAVCEIMWKNMVQPDRPQMTIWYCACWVTRATDTRTDFVVLLCFSTATVVARTRLCVTCICTLPVLFLWTCIIYISLRLQWINWDVNCQISCRIPCWSVSVFNNTYFTWFFFFFYFFVLLQNCSYRQIQTCKRYIAHRSLLGCTALSRGLGFKFRP